MRIFTTILILAAVAVVAFGGDPVPVYGPARVGVEDPDLLADTVLDVGVLAVSSYDLTRVVIGDGITPGGVEIHPAGCVRGFGDISDATTNLNMRTYAIQWGAWQARGDLNALSFTYGPNDLWMRFVRDTGSAYLPFNLTIGDGVFQFTVPSVEGMPEPVLQVTTNLLEDFAAAPAGTYGTSRPNAAQLVIAYTNATDRALFFRIFDAAGLRTGVYHYVPVVATAGITMGADTWTELPDVGGIRHQCRQRRRRSRRGARGGAGNECRAARHEGGADCRDERAGRSRCGDLRHGGQPRLRRRPGGNQRGEYLQQRRRPVVGDQCTGAADSRC